MAAVLDAVLCGHDIVPIKGDSVSNAAAIGIALSVLPERVVQRYWWFTHILDSPHTRSSTGVVSGYWPDLLASTKTGRRVNEWLSTPGVIRARFDRQSEVIAWLVGQGRSGSGRVDRYRSSATESEFVSAIAARELTVREQDIDDLLRRGDSILTEPQAQSALTVWVGSNAVRAMTFAVSSDTDTGVANAIVDALLGVHERARTGSNPVYFPPASEPVYGWHTILARYLCELYPDKPAMLAFVQEQLLASGRPLDTEDAMAKVPDRWWSSIGLQRSDFGVPVQTIVYEIRTQGTVSASLEDAVYFAADRLTTVLAIVEEFRHHLPVAAAAVVIELAGEHMYPVTLAIVQNNARYGHHLTAQWADSLIQKLPGHEEIVVALWEELAADRTPVHQTLLVRVLRAHERRTGVEFAMKTLLAVAAKELETRATAPVRHERPQESYTDSIMGTPWSNEAVNRLRPTAKVQDDFEDDTTWSRAYAVVWPIVYILIGSTFASILLLGFDRLG
ncbi:hypothetical protein AB0L82_36300 [Nocardia sp. NPDC052001]|uniref:hypothetical protein n=1 Tax=Nocardia sp. NPDC052001 TaxID=3154853 RepID=UPI00342AFEA0